MEPLKLKSACASLLSLLFAQAAFSFQSCDSVLIGHFSSFQHSFHLLAWDPHKQKIVSREVKSEKLEHPDPTWIWEINTTSNHMDYTISQKVDTKDKFIINTDENSETHQSQLKNKKMTEEPVVDESEISEIDREKKADLIEKRIFLSYNESNHSVSFTYMDTPISIKSNKEKTTTPIREEILWHITPVNHSFFTINPYKNHNEVLSFNKTGIQLVNYLASYHQGPLFNSRPFASMPYLLSMQSAITGKQCYINLSSSKGSIEGITALFESFVRPHLL